MGDRDMFQIFLDVLYIIPILLLVAISIYSLWNKKTIASYLLSAGSILVLMITLTRMTAFPILKKMNRDGQSNVNFELFFGTINVFKFLGFIIFSIGFFLVIRESIKNKSIQN